MVELLTLRLAEYMGNYKSVEDFNIYKWAAYCLYLHEDEDILPLFWQIFFALYFEATRHGELPNFYGYHFLSMPPKTCVYLLSPYFEFRLIVFVGLLG